MSARSRSNRPPYEVMSGRGVSPGGRGAETVRPEGSPALSVSPASASSATAAAGGAAGLGEGSTLAISGGGAGQPLLLRVPRGVAVMAVVVALLVIILAYWVGRTQGRHAVMDEYGISQAAQANGSTTTADGGIKPAPTGALPSGNGGRSGGLGRNNGGAGAGGLVVPDPQPISASDLPREDTREAGLNYLVLALYDRAAAVRLVDFLARNGVDAAIVPSNNRQFSVVDLRGFTAAQIKDSSAYREHRDKLRQLGRSWKRDHNGPSDLSDMWPKKQ